MAVTLKTAVYFELQIKKSRFLAWVEPMPDAEAAKARLAACRVEHPGARHICFVFSVPGTSGMSDDGEPSGTAAKPMVNVLNHKGLVSVMAIVVRYFGGIKLGAGGLSRAYGGAVAKALEQAEYQTVERQWSIQISCPFARESQIRRVCETYQVELLDVQYSAQVSARLVAAESIKTALLAALQATAPGNSDLVVRLVD
jgi:uncharacterized YigZ family protein